jgi:hypothetical protein
MTRELSDLSPRPQRRGSRGEVIARAKPLPAFGHPPLRGEGLGDQSSDGRHYSGSPLLVGEGLGVRCARL